MKGQSCDVLTLHWCLHRRACHSGGRLCAP